MRAPFYVYRIPLAKFRLPPVSRSAGHGPGAGTMKVRNSLKSLAKRDKNCRIVRRKGRLYVINKTNPRFKARQG